MKLSQPVRRIINRTRTTLAICMAVLIVNQYSWAQRQFPISVGHNNVVVMPQGGWTNIGVQYHVGYSHLERANPNGFRPGTSVLIPGRHIVPPLLQDGIIINQPELMLYLVRNGQVVNWYPISIGMMTSRWHTPMGRLAIISRTLDPTWHRPSWAGGGEVGPGPRNPLGDRWLGLNRRGYGIHGTNDPTSIGRTVSHGCIRLYPQHIRDLFDQTWVRMPVFITYETVMVGADGNTIYLAIFPDIYDRGTNKFSHVRDRLEKYGVSDAISDSELHRRIDAADGVARPLLGSDIPVAVNGVTVSTATGPTVRDGVAYLPAKSLAEGIGANIAIDPKSNTFSINHQDHELTVRADGQRAFIARGMLFVSVRHVIESLGGKVTFTKDCVAIHI